MKKIIGLSLVGFLLIGLTTVVFASGDAYPQNDNTEYEDNTRSESFDDWHEERFIDYGDHCFDGEYGYGPRYNDEDRDDSWEPHYRDEDREDSQGSRFRDGSGNGEKNNYRRGMMGY